MKELDVLWDDNPVDITEEANFIWSIANKLRGTYMPDKYGDVIIPMTIIRRLECALASTKDKVVSEFKSDPNTPERVLCKHSGFEFYNTSEFTLKELCNDPDHIESNFLSYISRFSPNVAHLLNDDDTLNIKSHIKQMNKGGCLYNVVKAFSELDLSPKTYDSIKMGYIFENLIGRFFQNVDAGQFYTGRDIIKLCVSLLISEGCDDIFEKGKVITVCDQACGTGGMLSTAYSYLKHYNPDAVIKLFGQEYMGVSHAVGLAEMLIKGQNAANFRHADTFKEDCFPDQKMRFVLENPPFGTPWGGKDAKDGQEDAVKEEFKKGISGRWGAGLPGIGDGQLLFVQSAIAKLTDNGRAAIIENGSPLFTGGTASGESQIRRYLLEKDLIEAIIQLPTDLFYNTGISTYIWIISKNKRAERKGKIQLIDASNIYHKLRKPLGNKKNEFLPDDRKQITKLYADFTENELVKIFDNTEFMYREYSVMQPLQRSYSITEDSINNLLQKGTLNKIYNESAVAEFENLLEQGLELSTKDKKKYDEFIKSKSLYESIITTLKDNISDKKWLSPEDFAPVIKQIFEKLNLDKKLIASISDALSVMDKEAVIQKDKKDNILYDKETKDIEIVKYEEKIEDYMAREVLPHVPDAQWFFEENLSAAKPVIKVGAEIPFTRYFYKYQQPTPSSELEAKFIELEKSVSARISKLFGGN
ncbi:N-6 DNA methylase [Succinivibrio sp.]|uniref:type I restriction-modification system subunit M n=1 Tax=Succinivibrio sp. TaxID=2053619 RepID=UPI00386B6BDD